MFMIVGRLTSRAAVIALLGLLALSAPVFGQRQDPPATEPDATVRSDRLWPSPKITDPSVPAGAIRGYLQACRGGDWKAASESLNLSALPPDDRADRGLRIAWQLKVVLDRALPIAFERMSHDPQGNTDDGLPANVDMLGKIEGVEILLEKQLESDRWVFAASTVASVPDLYQRYGYGVLGEYLPAPMFEISWMDLQLWQWAGIVFIAFVAYVVASFVSWLTHRVARRIAVRSETKIDDRLVDKLTLPFRLLVAVGIFSAGAAGLALPIRAYGLIANLAVGVAVLIVTWLILRVIDLLAKLLQENLEESGRRSAVAVLPLARRGLKAFFLAIALVALLQNVGFNVTGLIAGLGVGGLAIALAAQKSIANLFGGVSLIADQPIQVGDFCRFGDGKMGTVEEIGLRSTRIRTLDRTLVTIPNAEFSEIQLENYGARDRIRLYAMIGLRYETSPDQLRHVLAGMRRLLIAHPMVTEAPARVRFVGFGAHSLDVELFAYVQTANWDEFLQVREDILLRLMDIVRQSGTGFAFPSQTLYLGRDTGLDETHAAEAEKQVRAWKDQNELPFPHFPPALVEEIDGTLDYPPVGSAFVAGPAPDEPETPTDPLSPRS